MLLFYLNGKNQKQARFIRNLYRSYPGDKELQATSRFEDSMKMNDRADVIVFAGMIRGEGIIHKYCRARGKKFIYVDHAYLNRGYNIEDPDNEWMRITYNSFTWNKNQPESADRWKKHFAETYQMMPWNTREGSSILVLPPSEATKYLFPESVEWTNRMIAEVSSRLNLPIKIREKPNQPQIDRETNEVVGRVDVQHTTTIEEDLASARCVIAYNSAVPVQATLMGIPCICSPEAAAYPISMTLDKIKYPPEPDRQRWLDQLVYHQYTTTEMKTGEAWTMLERYMR